MQSPIKVTVIAISDNEFYNKPAEPESCQQGRHCQVNDREEKSSSLSFFPKHEGSLLEGAEGPAALEHLRLVGSDAPMLHPKAFGAP